ncbi:MAG TPA: DUF2298 domain-containing protein, partial [Chloroflexota bacterium]|nr:DUF2298 domain-containing protein [Chloroflexota bacterium]
YPDLGHQFSPVSPTNAGDGRMGEKQMEMAYINAIVRSRVFPPLDPFYAHGYINYYYYGFYLVATLCKLTQIVPTTGFNLAIAMFFALLVTGVFSVGVTLTRRLLPGLIAAVFVGAIGNLAGALQVIQGLMSVATIHSTFPFFGGVADIADGVFQVVVQGRQLPPFDFWSPTRIIPPTGAVISEFPYFTYLFADLHPHLIAYPMTAAALALAVSLALGTRLRTSPQIIVTVLGAALVLGALIVTNPWDFPTYLVVVGLGAVIGMAWRARSWRALVEPAGGIVLVAALSFLLYLPFERSYHTVFSTGIGLVRNITPVMLGGICPNGETSCPSAVHDALVTPLPLYLEHFGLFYFVAISYLIVLAVRAWRASGRHFDRTATALVLGGAVLVAGLAIFGYWLLAFLFALGAAIGWIVLQRGFRLERRQVFVLALILIPIGLSIVTQIVFVKDWLAGGPNFRMNTIFKFYNQAWVMLAVAAACALYFFMAEQVGRGTAAIGRRIDSPNPTTQPREGLPADALMIGEVARRAPVAPTTVAMAGDGSAASPLIPPAPFSRPQEKGERTPLSRLFPLARARERGLGGEGTRRPWSRILALVDRRPLWSIALAGLIIGSCIYTYAGTAARETYRETWLPENSVPLTLDGAAFLKVAYPADYAGIQWLNAHVRGAPIVAEAPECGFCSYDWAGRVAEFTGLPDVQGGIHEGEQRWGDNLTRGGVVNLLFSSMSTRTAWTLIHRYGIGYIFVGFLETHCTYEYGRRAICYPDAGITKFHRMVGHGLAIAFHRPGITIYAALPKAPEGQHRRAVQSS